MEVQNRRLVSDRMSTQLTTLEPKDNLGDALMILCSEDRRHIPIVEGGRLVGIVSDRDIKRHLPTKENEVDVWEVLEKVTLEQFMTNDLITVEPDAELRDAAAIMLRGKISALPVLKGQELVGIVTTEDILWEYLES